jgi:hypothetical protein
LRQALRIALGRDPKPSAGGIDSQSGATGPGAGTIGNDPARKVRGGTRHLLVETAGRLVTVEVSCNVQDPTAGDEVLEDAKGRALRLGHVPADARDQGELVDWAKQQLGISLEIVTRPPGQRGVVVQARRWVIERGVPVGPAGLDRFRRLARDWEAASWSACAFVHIAASNLMARRIARYQPT